MKALQAAGQKEVQILYPGRNVFVQDRDYLAAQLPCPVRTHPPWYCMILVPEEHTGTRKVPYGYIANWLCISERLC